MSEIQNNSTPTARRHPLSYPLSFERLPFEESVKRGFVVFEGNGDDFEACTSDGRYHFSLHREGGAIVRSMRWPPEEKEVYGGLDFLNCLRGQLVAYIVRYDHPPIPHELWKVTTFDDVTRHVDEVLVPAIKAMGRKERYQASVLAIIEQYNRDYPEEEWESPAPTETTPVNVASNSKDWTEVALSNLTPAPFVLDGRRYESVEGFWQGLKFPDQAKRDEVAKMAGLPSKKIGDSATPAEMFDYEGRTYRVGSPEHLGLMYRAIRAKLEQNPKVLELLLATGNRPIIHHPVKKDGTPYPDSVTVPAETFSRMLMELRSVLAPKS